MNPYQAPTEASAEIDGSPSKSSLARRLAHRIMSVLAWFWTIPLVIIALIMAWGAFRTPSLSIVALLYVLASYCSVRAAFRYEAKQYAVGNRYVTISVALVLISLLLL
jgi:uncharacterized membrane protein